MTTGRGRLRVAREEADGVDMDEKVFGVDNTDGGNGAVNGDCFTGDGCICEECAPIAAIFNRPIDPMLELSGVSIFISIGSVRFGIRRLIGTDGPLDETRLMGGFEANEAELDGMAVNGVVRA